MADLLSFRPRPEPGELCSSWLARLSVENGLTVARLIASCVPDTHYPTLDLDQHLPRPLLHRLEARTGLPWPVIERTTLRALHDLYVGRRVDHGGYRWFMPVHPVRQRFTLYGQQVCPDCLAADAVPYFRQVWRLSFVTTCPVHGCLLLDRCPACAAPVDPRGACDGRDELFDQDALCRCGGCGSDYRDFAWQRLGEDVTPEARRVAWGAAADGRRVPQEAELRTALNWQQRVIEPMEGRFVRVGGLLVEVAAYLDGCRQLLRLLCGERYAEGFSRLVSERSNHPRRPLTGIGRLRFERAEVGVRHLNIRSLSWLLADWPISFQRLCLESGISRTALLYPATRAGLPEWYERQCSAVLGARAGKWSQAESALSSADQIT
jgi:TniQ